MADVVWPHVSRVRVTKAIEIIQLMMFGFRTLLSIWCLTINRVGIFKNVFIHSTNV